VQAEDSKKHYSAPQLKKLNFEQASLFLIGHAWNGDSDANHLLDLISPLQIEGTREVKPDPSHPFEEE
jgi:hypothetical protein